MVIAYLVNQYPKVSHSFIRREILALEDSGVTVHRYSIRRAAEPLVDPGDMLELSRTTVLLDAGITGLILALARSALFRPLAFARALSLTLRAGSKSDRGIARHLAYLGEAAMLTTCLQRCQAVHLHAHFATNSATVAMLSHALGGPPFSFTAHGPDDFDRAAWLSLPTKITRAAMAASVSGYGRRQLLRWCPPQLDQKIHIVPSVLDDAFLRHPPVPIPDAPRLVFVGRLEPQKNPLQLVAAAALLRDAGIRFELIVIGDGALRQPMEARIRELDLGDSITLRGAASAADIRDAILASRALVLPSADENLPLAIMEALALGRPAIATDVGGVSELVTTGHCGWLLPPCDLPALAAAMQQALLASPRELEQMGRAGALRVAAHHDGRLVARQLIALFSHGTSQ